MSRLSCPVRSGPVLVRPQSFSQSINQSSIHYIEPVPVSPPGKPSPRLQPTQPSPVHNPQSLVPSRPSPSGTRVSLVWVLGAPLLVPPSKTRYPPRPYASNVGECMSLCGGPGQLPVPVAPVASCAGLVAVAVAVVPSAPWSGLFWLARTALHCRRCPAAAAASPCARCPETQSRARHWV